ncbi:hypothetical protein G3N58_05930 [Paraburkholderia sp. Ac-20342]|uniref:hypothetical protein n=1 Tax=unclassified Paraburkholderia TaxID=2615204 RepID=UPI00141FECE3|nr:MULTISPECIES: hypothetical protein [unclassified Paraburkholderia]MBN3846371.1 hypothetical protein [Paraburkholderia sp. Ac-20342]NIF76857.1 hypothetical protein [Paraburkholderia sp. Cy-641]
MNGRPLAPRRVWWLAAGFTIWCLALVILYALHAIGCAFAWSAGPLRASLAIVLLLHLIAIGGLWRYRAAARHDPGPEPISSFMHSVVIWTLIAALVATVITFGPALLLTTCV